MFFCTQPGGHIDPLTGFHQAAGRDMEMRTVDLAPSEVVAVLIQGSSDHSATRDTRLRQEGCGRADRTSRLVTGDGEKDRHAEAGSGGGTGSLPPGGQVPQTHQMLSPSDPGPFPGGDTGTARVRSLR